MHINNLTISNSQDGNGTADQSQDHYCWREEDWQDVPHPQICKMVFTLHIWVYMITFRITSVRKLNSLKCR